MIHVKSAEELTKMRHSGRIVAEVLQKMRELVAPGVTTEELNAAAEEIILGHGAIPSFKGYPPGGRNPFPASICASVNEELVHGIPGPRTLKEGEIISIDVGAIHDGYHGDAAVTLPVGKISAEVQDLLKVTEEALSAGIAQACAGNRTGDVSAAIQTHVEQHGYSVVREYTGHGIGRQMHEEPQIPNYGEPGRGTLLRRGMTMALEPMVLVGDHRVRVLDDHWTVVSAQGRLTAHFEHTIAVQDGEAEILTRL
jgi:methionyl aminopeptidase